MSKFLNLNVCTCTYIPSLVRHSFILLIPPYIPSYSLVFIITLIHKTDSAGYHCITLIDLSQQTAGHLLFAVVLTIYIVTAVKFFEEPALMRLFGDPYQEYMKTVPRFIPGNIVTRRKKECDWLITQFSFCCIFIKWVTHITNHILTKGVNLKPAQDVFLLSKGVRCTVLCILGL